MAVIVCLSGRPGSGKSQVARCIKGDEFPFPFSLKEKRWLDAWEVVHITDYKHLFLMFQQEEGQELHPEERCFKSSGHGGFNVTDFGFSHGVLDKALEQVNSEILQEIASEREQKQKLILVEFARSNYRSLKNVFDPELLERAFVLYLQTNLAICVSRVHQRVRCPRWEDDSFVSDEIMTGYYQKEDLAGLLETFGEKRMRLIHNNGEWTETWAEVEVSLTEILSECKEDQAQQTDYVIAQPDESEKNLDVVSSPEEEFLKTPAA